MSTTSVEFLERFFAGTEHNIEIRSLRGGHTQQTFSRDPTVLANAIRSCLGVKMNVYFGCATRREKNGTAVGVAEITVLWTDLDCKTLSKEDALRKIKEFPVEPSIIIDSGGGFHVYWLLTEPRDAHDHLVRRVLRGLCSALGGDIASAEIARILRVPGTKNFKPEYAEPRDVRIVEASWERYGFNQFEDYAEAEDPDAADEVSDYDRSGDQLAAKVDAITDEALLERINKSRQGLKFRELLSATGSGYFKRVEAVAATLAWWTRANAARMDRIISASELITGNGGRLWWWNQRKYKGNASRKEYVLSRACAMVSRRGMYDPTEEPEVAALLEEFNERFYVVEDLGGKCRVAWEENKPSFKLDKPLLNQQSFPDFRNRFMHQHVKVGEVGEGKEKKPVYESKAKVWLGHTDRRQYVEVGFAPGLDLGPNVRNLWHGFAFEPKPGDCKKYLAHVLDNICQGNKDHYGWLMGWMAYAVRNPAEIGHVAVVLRGEKGVGKNVFAEAFNHLWGGHGIVLSNEKYVTSNFNAHLLGKTSLVADEAFFAGDPRQARLLKGLVTGDTLAIESKGVNVIMVPNFLHIIIIGNDDWLVSATGDERRFFALECGDGHREDHTYFAGISEELKNGGHAALLHHLLNEVSLANFNIRKAPHTGVLRDQMAESAEGAAGLWLECLWAGELPGSDLNVKNDDDGTVWLHLASLLEFGGKRNPKQWGRVTSKQMGAVLGKGKLAMGFKPAPRVGNDLRRWEIPPLAKCRALWNKKRYEVDWPKDDGNWNVAPAKLAAASGRSGGLSGGT